jgi:Uma2 family endonuclease
MSVAAKSLERHHFSTEDVLRMVDAGVLHEDDHVELVEGEVLEMTPQGPEHRSLKDELHARLADAYRGQSVHVLNQGPVLATSDSLPEPDLAVIRGRARDYLDRHPAGTDAVLVVEIAKTSQERDRAKAAVYARGEVPVYWLLDIAARTLDVYTEPDRERGRYRRLVSLRETEDAVLPELGATWSVASLLP